MTEDKLTSYLNEYFSDSEAIHFLDYIPQDFDFCECCEGTAIVVKGHVIKPEPATIVKAYKIE